MVTLVRNIWGYNEKKTNPNNMGVTGMHLCFLVCSLALKGPPPYGPDFS